MLYKGLATGIKEKPVDVAIKSARGMLTMRHSPPNLITRQLAQSVITYSIRGIIVMFLNCVVLLVVGFNCVCCVCS